MVANQQANAQQIVTALAIFLGRSEISSVMYVSAFPENSSTNLDIALAQIVQHAHEFTTEDLYATYKNPFYNYLSETATPNVTNSISAQQSLSLWDGGEALQNNPTFLFLQPARNVSVTLVNDNSNDSGGWPNGREIMTT